MKQVVSINYIDNREERNKEFIELFSSFESQGYGKKLNSYFIIQSDISIRPNNKIEQAFSMIQQHSSRRGFSYNMFIIK